MVSLLEIRVLLFLPARHVPAVAHTPLISQSISFISVLPLHIGQIRLQYSQFSHTFQHLHLPDHQVEQQVLSLGEPLFSYGGHSCKEEVDAYNPCTSILGEFLGRVAESFVPFLKCMVKF